MKADIILLAGRLSDKDKEIL